MAHPFRLPGLANYGGFHLLRSFEVACRQNRVGNKSTSFQNAKGLTTAQGMTPHVNQLHKLVSWEEVRVNGQELGLGDSLMRNAK